MIDNHKYLTIKKLQKMLDEYLVENISVYKTKDQTPFFDFLVICDCSNEKIVTSIGNKIINFCKENQYSVKLFEFKNPRWIIIDFYSIVLHIFEESERVHFNLDSLWNTDNEVIGIKEHDLDITNKINSDNEVIHIREIDLDKENNK